MTFTSIISFVLSILCFLFWAKSDTVASAVYFVGGAILMVLAHYIIDMRIHIKKLEDKSK